MRVHENETTVNYSLYIQCGEKDHLRGNREANISLPHYLMTMILGSNHSPLP